MDIPFRHFLSLLSSYQSQQRWKFAISQKCSWCFAYDKLNYVRYLFIYHAQITRFPEDQQNVCEQLSHRAFSIQHFDTNVFESKPVDQTVEKIVKKNIQTAGGANEFSLKESIVSRNCFTCARLIQKLIDRKILMTVIQT